MQNVSQYAISRNATTDAEYYLRCALANLATARVKLAASDSVDMLDALLKQVVFEAESLSDDLAPYPPCDGCGTREEPLYFTEGGMFETYDLCYECAQTLDATRAQREVHEMIALAHALAAWRISQS